MDDTISRQAVFDTAAEYEKQLREIYGDENELVETVKILKHRLIALPSVQPQSTIGQLNTDVQSTKTDCISRQAAIKTLEKGLPSEPLKSKYTEGITVGFGLAITWIEQLPAAQPDNSCDGCRYENADDGVLIPCGFKRSHPDNYERRTDDER